jgi:23S rRNA (guanosine2251-2'-O)-methyltransferase
LVEILADLYYIELGFLMDIVSLASLLDHLNENRPLQRVFISRDRKGSKLEMIKRLCAQNGVLFQLIPQSAIDRKAGKPNQGIFAQLSPVRFFSMTEILNDIQSGLILILDQLNDVGNIGAIIRSSVAAGVDGIVISSRRTAPINETVLKTSAGSLLKARIVLSKNLVNEIQVLKKNQFWIVGTDVREGTDYTQHNFGYKTAIIVGNEEKGISQRLKKSSDFLITIPHSKNVDSLNVSVSTAVILFEALRQKRES